MRVGSHFHSLGAMYQVHLASAYRPFTVNSGNYLMKRKRFRRWLRGLLHSTQIELKTGAAIHFAGNGDSAVVQIQDALDDRQAEPG